MTTQPPAAVKTRLVALDVTKGVLVVFMAAYHCLNYSSEYYLGFRYFSFLPPSFILISGFVISNIYWSRYDPRDVRMYLRLVSRGIKLLLLFTLLNVGSHLSHGQGRLGRSIDLATFYQHWREVYVAGSAYYAAFGVLLPIAYLLICAPAFIRIRLIHKHGLTALACLLAILCVAMERSGALPFNLGLLAAGAVGMALGTIRLASLTLLANYPLLLLSAYASTAFVGFCLGESYLIQLAGATTALAAIFALSQRADSKRWIGRWLTMLGKYSLVSYIAQIALLQILGRFFQRPDPLSLGFSFMFVATVTLMTAVVWLVDSQRTRSATAAAVYKAVFA